MTKLKRNKRHEQIRQTKTY